MTLVYLTCLVIGFLYALIAGAFGHFFGDGDGGAHGGSDVSISPISPTIIATFITCFGGIGLIVNNLYNPSAIRSAAIAAGGAAVISAAVFGLLEYVASRTQAGSEFASSELVGSTAEVITPIPENGYGEIVYLAKGARYTGHARSADGKPIGKASQVVIVGVSGSTFMVKPHGSNRA